MAVRKTRRKSRVSDPLLIMAERVRQLKSSTKHPAIAVAVFNDPKVKGAVLFLQVGKEVHVEAHIWDLPSGKHGFHIHEYGSLLEGCASLGAHWNPKNRDHGSLHSSNRHMGDFGNIKKNMKMKFKISPASISGSNDPFSLLGRSVVIHEGEDDLGLGSKSDSKTTGGSGARIGFAIIGLA